MYMVCEETERALNITVKEKHCALCDLIYLNWTATRDVVILHQTNSRMVQERIPFCLNLSVNYPKNKSQISAHDNSVESINRSDIKHSGNTYSRPTRLTF